MSYKCSTNLQRKHLLSPIIKPKKMEDSSFIVSFSNLDEQISDNRSTSSYQMKDNLSRINSLSSQTLPFLKKKRLH